MREASKLLAIVAAISGIALVPASAAGAWKYQVIPNDGHVLAFSDDGKVTFYLGCGCGFALHVKYPGEAKKDGKARISISSGKDRMTLDGAFEEPIEVQDPAPMNFATDFQQLYLGYAKHDDRVYGKNWLALRSRLYALLGSAKPLTISAGKESYQLPALDAAGWRAPFEGCGLGASW
jgi:hypothetical protein